MADMRTLVDYESEADAYFKKILLRSGIFFLACVVLPWASMHGRMVFSWNFSGVMVGVLLVSGLVCLALGWLANLPAHLRAGIPAVLALVLTVIGVLTSGEGGGVSLSAGRASLQMHTLWPFAVIGLGFGCALYAGRPGDLIARIVIAAGAALCILGFLWPMGHSTITPLRAIFSAIGMGGGFFMSIALILLLLLFPAAIAAAFLVLPASDIEGRRNLAQFLSTGFVYILPAVFVVFTLAIWLHGLGMFFTFYMAGFMAIDMLLMARGGAVLVARLTSGAPAGSSGMVTLDSVQPRPDAPSPESLLQAGAQPPDDGLPPRIARKLEVLENLYQRGQITREQFEERKKYIVGESES